ncbi:MAG: DNA-binding protein [Elusimicrobia bacterium HGW-Elusimicrobia-1]|jgi:hypothetical protein|nr:MAG: DNA-binding protein [Elusimicrobia bacterium HGW-Elusimicrobia-1]
MSKEIIPSETLVSRILVIRGCKVMLDRDLAELYGVSVKVFNQAVKRNIDRFPEDFCFQLSKEESEILRSQFVTSSFWGGRRYLPYAFTEHGAIQAANVLNSPRAVQMGVAIVRAFVRLRELLSTHKDIQRKVEEHDGQIKYIFQVINKMLTAPKEPRKKIGFAK